MLKGHQWPWFPKFFTRELDKGGQINKGKQKLKIPLCSPAGVKPWDKINPFLHFRLTELVNQSNNSLSEIKTNLTKG